MTTVPSPGSRVPGRLTVEESPLGRVYVWRNAALFYTTSDFDGYLTDRSVPILRDFLKSRFGIDGALYTCRQVHGVDASRVTRDPGLGTRDLWNECDSCDALWTDQNGVALGIKVADCLPVTIIDPDHGVIANIHSGWRGTAKRITAVTLEQLRAQSAFSPESARAYFGPSIRQCCFEVGEEVVQQFPDGERYVARGRGPRPYLDLVTLTTDLLVNAGFARDAVHDSELCTRCDGSHFHSYRRNRAASGRNLAIVAQ